MAPSIRIAPISAAVLGLVWVLPAEEIRSGNGYVVPEESQCQAVRKRFQDLARPLPYRYVVDTPSRSIFSHDAKSHFELSGDAMRLVEQTAVPDLVYGLWTCLDDTQTEAEAYIVLSVATKRRILADLRFAYRSATDPGNWPRLRQQQVELCRRACRQVLGEPECWYPHKVLFDADAILRDRKDPAARSRNIAAMVQALADPGIRSENPLEVKSALSLLFALRATEAASTFRDYMFYDWQQGRDYRLAEGDTRVLDRYEPREVHNVYQISLPYRAYLAELGTNYVDLALSRFAGATEEERSVRTGGGGTTVLGILYFIRLGYTPSQTLAAIEAHKVAHPEMTASQRMALDELATAINDGLYRPRGLAVSRTPAHREWANVPAAAATNGVARP
jgi:hypothetical protein